MKFTKMSGALGADVTGIDLARPLDPATTDAIKQLWSEHLVLRFRGQQLTPEGLISFSRSFGDLERHDNYVADLRHREHPDSWS
ncbi:hypothetical protein BH10PSE17_BH10PSE17_01380 [soil metagenome]